MNTTTEIVIAAIIGIVVGAGGAMAFTKPTTSTVADNTAQHMVPNGQAMGGTSMNMQQEMASMNAGLQGKTGDAFDQEFLSEMIVHHQGAVQMAQLALQNAKHPEIKQLAQGIITAQDKEIIEMQGWQKSWYGTSSSTPAQ